jgi:hypothetical protein
LGLEDRDHAPAAGLRGGERRAQTARAQQPGQHPGDRALAARAGDGDARLPRVHYLGQECRPRHQIDAERARRAHLRRVGLDGGGVDDAVDAGIDRAPVVRAQVDAQAVQAAGDLVASPGSMRRLGAAEVPGAGS